MSEGCAPIGDATSQVPTEWQDGCAMTAEPQIAALREETRRARRRGRRARLAIRAALGLLARALFPEAVSPNGCAARI